MLRALERQLKESRLREEEERRRADEERRKADAERQKRIEAEELVAELRRNGNGNRDSSESA